VGHAEHETVERHRLREQESLPVLDAEMADAPALIVGFDAFGDNRKVQRLGQFHDGGNDGDGLRPLERIDEGFVDRPTSHSQN
jgi:hypothetical protein